ncbi:MAG: Na/Pi cotransporter family protein [Desulfomonilia bacterium]
MIYTMLLATLGGLGLFLFGMHIMSDSLQKIAGLRLRRILEKLTTNRIVAVLAGAAITSIIQSSSATTVMSVGLVNAGLMTLKQAIGVVIGANIGTTITAQIIAFKLTDIALPLIGVGMFMKLLSKREKVKYWGDFFLGFGLLFYGLLVMKEGVQPLQAAPWVSDFFIHFSKNPLWGVLVGTLITMLFQSSSATVGLVIALASSGVLEFTGAAALVLGDNIGTTITAQLSSIGTNVPAKRVARSHLLFNLFGVCIILLIFPAYVRFVDFITPGDPMQVINGNLPYSARHIANFHTLFNVTNSFIFIPLMGVLARLSTYLAPGEIISRVFRLESLDERIFETPSIALDEARQEIEYMGKEVFSMLEITEKPLIENTGTDKILSEVMEKEDLVDALQKEINTYLTELSRQYITEDQSKEIFSMMHMVSNLERIADHCESIAKLCKKRNEFGIVFSEDGNKDMYQIYHHTLEYLRTIMKALKKSPENLMDLVRSFEPKLNTMRWEMRVNHMERLKTSVCNADAGLVYVDMLTSFEKIGDHAYNIAESLSGIK